MSKVSFIHTLGVYTPIVLACDVQTDSSLVKVSLVARCDFSIHVSLNIYQVFVSKPRSLLELACGKQMN